MTEYEVLELISTYREEGGFHVMNFAAAMFGYVAAAYFVGKNLTRFQTVSITILYSLFVPGPMAASYEEPKTIPANTLIPSDKLVGERYKVIADVATDGLLTRAVIESDYGVFEAVGPGMLKIRLHEVDALAKLEELESSDEFQKGAQQSFDDKVDAFKQLADKPEETADGIGAGVSRFFKRVKRSTKTGVQKANDVLNEETPGVSEGGGGENLPGASSASQNQNSDDESKYTKAAKASGDVAVNILGFDDSRRKLAKRLGVDPYTTNPVLDEKLDEVTRSIFAGDFAVDVATSLIPGSIIVTASSLATNWVWDTPPGDLRVAIEKKLLAMEFSQEEIDRLLRHRWYPLSYQAALTGALDSMEGAVGRTDIMPLVLSVTGYDQARFVVNTLRMLDRYHHTVEELDSIGVFGTIIGSDNKGNVVIAAPVDYVSWTAYIDKFSSRPEFEKEKIRGEKRIFIAGVFTPLAHETLSGRGWNLSENSELLEIIGTATE